MSAAIAFGVSGGQTVVRQGSLISGEYQQLPSVVEDVSVGESTISRQSSLSQCSEVSNGAACRAFLKCLFGVYQELRFQLRMMFQPATSLAFLDAFKFEESCLPEEIQYEYTFEERTRLAEICRQRVGAELRIVLSGCACFRCQALMLRPRSAETALGLHRGRTLSVSLQQSGLFTTDDLGLITDEDLTIGGSRDMRRMSLTRTSLTRTSLTRNSFTRGSMKRSGSLPELWQLPELTCSAAEADLGRAGCAEIGTDDLEAPFVPARFISSEEDQVIFTQDEAKVPPMCEVHAEVKKSTVGEKNLAVQSVGAIQSNGAVQCKRAVECIGAVRSDGSPQLVGVVGAAAELEQRESEIFPSQKQNGSCPTADIDVLLLPKALEPYSPPSSLQGLVTSAMMSPKTICTKGVWNGRAVMRRTFQVHTSDPLLKERFLWEAAVTHALSHPNILKLYTCEVVLLEVDRTQDMKPAGDAFPAIWEITRVEEHFDYTLSHAMATGILSSATSWQIAVVQIMLDVACALQELHGHNIFYCYLQPSNIALTCCHSSTSLPPVFTAKLSDLQCSRFVRQYQSQAEDSPLTRDLLKYVAPEVLGSQAESPAADVYSVGVLLWELLWGEASMNAENHTPLAQTTDALQHLIHLARACLSSPPEQRPDMSDVVHCLKGAMVSLLVSTKQWV